MITVKDRERIRIAYFNEHKSIRRIARELHYSPKTIKKALASAEAEKYTLSEARAAPVLGPYKQAIAEMLAANDKLPAKQRYTSHRIYEVIRSKGYKGAESTVRGYVAQKRKDRRRPQVYLPLEFDPGEDAQVDWGEAWVELDGEMVKVQLFYIRLNYSRRVFVKAYPTQNQVAFFDGHVSAFHHFQGIPRRLAYDNLKAAVQKILEGRNRQEQDQFVAFRSHYLFESHFCTPGQAHEKGGVEHVVGFIRRNFLVPIPQADSWEALNALLVAACLADDQRQVQGQELPIAAAWERERPLLRPLPDRDFPCCTTKPVRLQPYSQVAFESNRYSVPADRVQKKLVIKAYALHIDILDGKEVLASHARCYGQGQEILDPLHYLPLLMQRPGAFEHAKPLRRWRQQWPPVYEELLAHLQRVEEPGTAVRHFLQVLALHNEYPATEIEQAVQQALAYGCAHVDGVKLCLHHLHHPVLNPPPLDLSAHPHLQHIAAQPVDLHRYEQLLSQVMS